MPLFLEEGYHSTYPPWLYFVGGFVSGGVIGALTGMAYLDNRHKRTCDELRKDMVNFQTQLNAIKAYLKMYT